MKLTLRTLLAYLDDTLDAQDIKIIGEKVAESENAQELVDRIKQVTRRRRLTNPPDTGPGAFDPNDVAEYLDNVLPGERLVEIEKQCLESDSHLAEVATCHQVLTLVLGEPALVPPKAKERMYQLVSGRESLPYKKAAPARVASGGVGDGDEEELVPGDNWLRWVLPAAGILLVLVLGLAVWQLTRVPGSRQAAVKNDEDKNGGEKKDDKEGGEKKDDKEKKKGPAKTKPGQPYHEYLFGKPGAGNTGGNERPPIGKPDEGNESPDVQPIPAASNERAPVARYLGAFSERVPTGLVGRKADAWTTVKQDERVYSTDTLVALPGLTSVVKADGGAVLTLRGSVPALAVADLMLHLLESSVVLHQPQKGTDLDLTLKRGRIYLLNKKPRGALRARVRFGREAWDITLPRNGDEVGIDLIKFYTPGINYKDREEPRAMAWLFVMAGDASVKVGPYAEPARLESDGIRTMMMSWDSFREASPPERLPKIPIAWRKAWPAPEELPGGADSLTKTRLALKGLEGLLKERPADAAQKVMKELVEDADPFRRVMAVYGFAALGDIDRLVELMNLDDKSRVGAAVREQAVFMVRYWLADDASNPLRLYNARENTGVLHEREYKTSEAVTILDLLFDLPGQDPTAPETLEGLANYLGNPRVAIAQLAYQNLFSRARLPEGFNAGETREKREGYARTIRALIKENRLRLHKAAKPMPR